MRAFGSVSVGLFAICLGGTAFAEPAPVAGPVSRAIVGVPCGGARSAAPASWADGPDDEVGCPTTRIARPCNDPCLVRRRGPIEVRDGYLLAQPFLTLAAVSPDTLGCGRTSLRVQAAWSNTFGWRQNESGETPARRYFLADGESRTGALAVAHGVTPDLDLGVRLAVHWRGGGVSDDWIDSFHEALSIIGLTDNERHDFRRDAFRINGRRAAGGTFNADEDRGTGLGNVELFGKWRFHDGGPDRWSWALVGRATAPTGTHPFDPSGVEGALQVVGARRLARDWDLYLGAGAIGRTETEFQGMKFSPVVGHVFVAAEYRLGSRWSLLAETDYATNLADGIERHDPDRWYLDVGAKVDLDPRTTLEFGFVENLISQQTTLDIGIHFGVEFRF